MRIISILAACAMFGSAVWAQAAVEDSDGDGIYSMEDGAVDEEELAAATICICSCRCHRNLR